MAPPALSLWQAWWRALHRTVRVGCEELRCLPPLRTSAQTDASAGWSRARASTSSQRFCSMRRKSLGRRWLLCPPAPAPAAPAATGLAGLPPGGAGGVADPDPLEDEAP